MTAAPEPTSTTAERLTARDILFTDPADAPAEIERALADGHVLLVLPKEVPVLTDVATRFVTSQVVQAIDDILGALGVDDLLTGAWTQLEEVQAAIEATAEDHGVRHITLARHQVASDHAPRVELLVNEAPVPLFELRLHLGFAVDVCELVVRDGKIDRVQVGPVAADGELGTATVMLLRHELADLDPTRLFTMPPDAH